MTSSIMVYALVVGTLFSMSALLVERISSPLRFGRRWIWLAALALSVLLPLLAVVSGGQEPSGANEIQSTVSRSPADAVSLEPNASVFDLIETPRVTWPQWNNFNAPLTALWISSSAVVLLLYGFAWINLYLNRRRWQLVQMHGTSVFVSEKLGPAVFGFMTPRIVVPAWLVNAEPRTRALVLQHEQEHIAAGDQRALLTGLLLVAIAPWNIALWWQLRRLRFALEVDCDARVMSRGTDAVEYSSALLSVQQRQLATLLGAVSLTERISDLERRIQLLVTGARRLSSPLIVLSVIGAATLLIAACAVQPPEPDALRKPPPAGLGQGPPPWASSVGNIVVERYGEQLEVIESGNALIDLVFAETGELRESNFEVTNDPPRPNAVGRFDRYGVTREAAAAASEFLIVPKQRLLASAGAPPAGGASSPGQTSLVAIYVHDPGHALIPSRAEVSTADVDRRIAQRYFPDIFSSPASPNLGLWVLFDSAGAVVASGRESLSADTVANGPPPRQVRSLVGARFPDASIAMINGAPIEDAQSQPVKDRSGADMVLYSLWLSQSSPIPTPQ